jgi:predicted Zn-ribbon and HTH transcriptional regulator
MNAETKKTGRPKGTRAEPAQTVVAEPTRCPKCQSTQRDKYLSFHEQAVFGMRSGGMPYTRIIKRRCRCANCGQVRIDKSYEFRPQNQI